MSVLIRRAFMANSVEEPISFVDPEVERLCVAKWGKNGVVTQSDLRKVTSIYGVFNNNTTITRFPELAYFTSLTTIDSYTFSGCTNLQQLIMPDSVTSIYSGAFTNCTSLSDIHISTNLASVYSFSGIFADVPKTNTDHLLYVDTILIGVEEGIDDSSYTIKNGTLYISDEVFKDKSLTSISLNSSLKLIGSKAFKNCINLTTITIPNSVFYISDEAFRGSGLQSISIGSGCTTIYNSALYDTDSLTSITISSGNSKYKDLNANGIFMNTYNSVQLVRACASTTIPSSVTSIGQNAYAYVTKNSLQIPNTVTTLQDWAFAYANINSITLSSNITSIPYSCFANTPNVTTVILGSNLTTIRSSAFVNSGITSIDIPAKCTSISNGSITTCPNLASITVAAGNTKYSGTIAPNAIVDKSTNSIIVGCKNTEFTSSVQRIGASSFEDSKIQTVDLSNSNISYIYGSAFENCSDLTSITFKANSTIWFTSDCFKNCTGLTQLEIWPENIEARAFYSCYNLTSITIHSTNPYVIENVNAFSNTGDCPIYVSASALNSYKTASKLSSISSRFYAIPT